MNRRMLRLARLATLALATLGGCTPEVELARQAASGAAGGSDAVGGSGGAASGRSGDGGNEDGGATEAGQPPVGPLARILADSVADFSLTQGEHGWYYGSDGGTIADFKLWGRTAVIIDFDPPSKDVWDCWGSDATHWGQIFRLGAHPNGTDTSPPSTAVLERAVRRWISDYEGDVVLSGEIAKIDVTGSNGVLALVYVDGAELYSVTLAGNDSAGLSYALRASVRVGSTVDFVLDPRENDHHDLSRFTGIVARAEPIPSP